MTPAEHHKRGYQDGRSGKEAQSKDRHYMRGYRQGEVALEEARSGIVFKHERD